MKQITKLILFFWFINSYSQNSHFIVTTENDTIIVEKYRLKRNKVKVRINGKNINYSFNQLKSIYDSKKELHLEKIKPAFVEYSEYSGTEFFAQRLTEGKIKIYKSSVKSLLQGENISFMSYYIGIQNSKPELLSYEWELSLTKEEYKLLKVYLHSNEDIQKKLDRLFFSEEKEKEKKVIQLVTEYNKWAG